MDTQDRQKRHAQALESALFRWFVQHPVLFSAQLNGAIADAMDRWLSQHSDELMQYFQHRLDEEMKLEREMAEKIP